MNEQAAQPKRRPPTGKIVLLAALLVALGAAAWRFAGSRQSAAVPPNLEQRASQLREDLRKSEQARPEPPPPPDPRADEPPSRNPRTIK